MCRLLRGSAALFAIGLGSVLHAAPTFSTVPSLSFVKVFGGADPLPQTVTITSTTTNFDFTPAATTDNGGTWLSVPVVGANCCATPRAVTVTVTTAANMATGTYTGHLTFTSFPGGTTVMTVDVTLTVESAAGTFFDNLSGQMSFSMKTGGGAITSRQIEVRNGGSGSLSWTMTKSTADGGSWLTASIASGTAPSVITLGIAVANLPGGGLTPVTAIGQLVFSQGAGGSVTVPVCVTVGDNVITQINGLHFIAVQAGASPLPQTLVVASSGTNFDFETNAYSATGGTWLSSLAQGFNCCATPRAVTVLATVAPTMPAGDYTGQVVFTSDSTFQAMTVPVTLTVEPVQTTYFGDLPGQLSFTLSTGAAKVTGQNLEIRNGGTGTLTWTASASTGDAGAWLTLASSSGTAPASTAIGISLSNLPGKGLVAGTFVGQILVSQSAGGSVTVPVSVVVGTNVFSQINGIHFTKVFAGADPLPQILSVPSTGAGFDFVTTSYTATGGDWLSTVATGFNCCATPRAVTAVVTTSPALAVGTYTGEIIFTAQGNGAMAITVPVTLTVEPGGGTFFDNMPGQISFSLKTGGSVITPQPIQIRNGGSGILSWTASASTADAGNWITLSAASGTAPSVVTIGITVTNLPSGGAVPGHFTGQVIFSQPSGGSVTVPVSVVVGSNIFLQVNPMNFTKVFAGPDPLPQTLLIASAGTNFDFDTDVHTATGGAWLSQTPVGFNCCATPRAITVTVAADPALAAGTYTGQIVFTVEGDGNMSITVPVSLTVEPVDATFLDDLQGQVSFSLTPGGGNPSPQDVQIRQRGPGSMDWSITPTTDDGRTWLTVSSGSGTGAATVHVGVVANSLPSNGLVAGSFSGELLVQSAASTISIPVSVTVGTNVFVQLPTATFYKSVGGSNPASQDLNIASTGAAFDFDHFWYNATGGSWLSVTVAGFNCCATPRAITANIVAAPALGPGNYTGEIVATAEGNGSSDTTIPVILRVTTLLSVTPSSGTVGQTLDVQIVGVNTNWVQGVTTIDFGAGVTVNSLTVTGPASATANITIAPTAATTARAITMTTGPEVTTLASGFTVKAFTCDTTGDGLTRVEDVQMVINEALGLVQAVHDLNHDGVLNVADIQKVAEAVLTATCPF